MLPSAFAVHFQYSNTKYKHKSESPLAVFNIQPVTTELPLRPLSYGVLICHSFVIRLSLPGEAKPKYTITAKMSLRG